MLKFFSIGLSAFPANDPISIGISSITGTNRFIYVCDGCLVFACHSAVFDFFKRKWFVFVCKFLSLVRRIKWLLSTITSSGMWNFVFLPTGTLICGGQSAFTTASTEESSFTLVITDKCGLFFCDDFIGIPSILCYMGRERKTWSNVILSINLCSKWFPYLKKY